MDRRVKIVRAHTGRSGDEVRAELDGLLRAVVRVVPRWCGAELLLRQAAGWSSVAAADATTAHWATRRSREVLQWLTDSSEPTPRRVAVHPTGVPLGSWGRVLQAAGVEHVVVAPLFPEPDAGLTLLAFVGPGSTPVGAEAAEGVALDSVAHRLEAWALREEVEELSGALESNRRIGVAVGVLVERLRITDQQAFALIAQASQDANVKVRDVADAIVLTGALPTRRPPRSR